MYLDWLHNDCQYKNSYCTFDTLLKCYFISIRISLLNPCGEYYNTKIIKYPFRNLKIPLNKYINWKDLFWHKHKIFFRELEDNVDGRGQEPGVMGPSFISGCWGVFTKNKFGRNLIVTGQVRGHPSGTVNFSTPFSEKLQLLTVYEW